jgi:hypothetical protein
MNRKCQKNNLLTMLARHQTRREPITSPQMPQIKSSAIVLLLGISFLITNNQLAHGSIDTKHTKANQLTVEATSAKVEATHCNEPARPGDKTLSVHDMDAAATTTRKRPLATSGRLSDSLLSRNKCAASERELDRCSAKLIGLGQSAELTYPDSMQELDGVYCPKFRDTVACIRNNTDCYKPFERQVINWILSSTKRMNYKRCKNENEKIRFLKLTSSCFASMRNPMDDCMGRYIGQLDAIADYNRDLERLSEEDIQIQLSCCANKRFKQCVMDSARRGCQSHESLRKLRRTNSLSSQRAARKQYQRVMLDTMDDLKTTLNEMALTGPEFICTGIDEKFCRAKFDGRYLNRVARHKSIVPAMIKIYANK